MVVYTADTKPTFTTITGIEAFTQALLPPSPSACPAQNATNEPLLRVYIVEDLSRDLIEVLGSQLNIDPLFFASHVDTRDAHEIDRFTGDRPGQLLASRKLQKWSQIRNLKFELYKDSHKLRKASRDTQVVNIQRLMLGNYTRGHPGHVSILTDNRTTICIGTDNASHNINVAVVLLDFTAYDPTDDDLISCCPRREICSTAPDNIGLSSSAVKRSKPDWYADIVDMPIQSP
jgi:hypothetical protein